MISIVFKKIWEKGIFTEKSTILNFMATRQHTVVVAYKKIFDISKHLEE